MKKGERLLLDHEEDCVDEFNVLGDVVELVSVRTEAGRDEEGLSQ